MDFNINLRIRMIDLLVNNSKNAKTRKIIARIINFIIIIGWSLLLIVHDISNFFWSEIIKSKTVPIFYKSLFYSVIYVFLGWLISIGIIKIIYRKKEFYEYGRKSIIRFLLVIVLVSLLIQSVGYSDGFIITIFLFVYFYIGYVFWEKIERHFYEDNPLMESVVLLNDLKKILDCEKNRSEFIVASENRQKFLPFIYIEYDKKIEKFNIEFLYPKKYYTKLYINDIFNLKINENGAVKDNPCIKEKYELFYKLPYVPMSKKL